MDEYISREEVINITAETGAWETQNRVRELPAADVQPVKHGRWISHGGNSYECSNCHKMIYNAKDMREHAFCGTCGSNNGR